MCRESGCRSDVLAISSGCGSRDRRKDDHRRHSEGDVARVLAEHSRGCRRKRRGSSASTSSGEVRFGKTIARRRSPKSRASSRAACPVSSWRRSTKRRSSVRSPTPRRASIPVVIIDSGLKSSDYVSFVATDNRKGGTMAAEALAKLLPDGGKVVMLRYAEGSASTHDREEGFLQEIARHTNILVVSYEPVRRRRCRRARTRKPKRCCIASGGLTDRWTVRASLRRTSRRRWRCFAC